MDDFEVIIADDHPIVRAGLRAMLGHLQAQARVREAASMGVLRGLLEDAPADLLLLDIFFPGLAPEDDISALRQDHPLMAILLVSMLTDRPVIERLLRAGANGFVSKSAPPERLEAGIRDVMNGGRPLHLPAPVRGRPSAISDNPLRSLPRRQAEVLQMICLGLSNKEIAKETGLSVSTVRGHVSALLHKLKVPNRASAASLGVTHGALASSDHAEDDRA